VALEFDHVFICVEDLPSSERILSEFGFEFSSPGIHKGQGTANACAFFDNAYLELLSRRNDDELQSELVKPVGLWQRLRWRETGASPFGIAFRPENKDLPVATWPYFAPFLPSGSQIPIVTPPLQWREPLTFISLKSQGPETLPPEQARPLNHREGRHKLTAVSVHCTAEEVSNGLRSFCELGLLTVKASREHHLQLELDSARRGETHDFRPKLPLELIW